MVKLNTVRQSSSQQTSNTVLSRRFVDQTGAFEASRNQSGKVTSLKFTAGMAVDVDGSGPHYGDRYAQSQTALKVGGKYLNADVTPYVALPPSVAKAAGMKLGDMVKVTAPNGKSAYGIYGDVSDDKASRKLGEGSPALMRALGYSGKTVDPTKGGVASGIKYELLPGTSASLGTLKNGAPTTASLQALGQKATGSGSSSATSGNTQSGDSYSTSSKALDSRIARFGNKYQRTVAEADITNGKAMLTLGDKGESVKALQKKLGIKADGLFGPQTLKAVDAFQKSNGLKPAEVDAGNCGKTTWNTLMKGTGATASSSGSSSGATGGASAGASSGATSAAAAGVSEKGQRQMQSLLARAQAHSAGKKPDGMCLKHVQNYLDQQGKGNYGKASNIARLPYAKDWGNTVNKNPAAYGLKKLNITNPYDAPAGAIVVVNPGTPGTRHPKAGDIAVSDGNGTFYNGGKMGYGGRQNFPAGNSHVVGIYVPA
jgi:peptidoglycan hydrolase-like protein with peptidoglycan-binding domain